MIKKALYPKTKRVEKEKTAVITEKLDGSNLVFFKKDGVLHIAQRNNIYRLDEIDEAGSLMYKGLQGWLTTNGPHLQETLYEGSAVCGEWMGMGRIKYGDSLDKRFYMFAKANITEEMELKNILYNHDLFIYPFVTHEIPEYIGKVPMVDNKAEKYTKEDLDVVYTTYSAQVDRPVEGFIVYKDKNISKYVRMKNGALEDHHE